MFKSALKTILTSQVTVRAVKTFIQAFIATWALTSFQLNKLALVGAVAAGLSAVMNLFPQVRDFIVSLSTSKK